MTRRKPAKALMTADTVGGVWSYALELIAEFENRGIEVLLATMGAPISGSQRAELRMLTNVEVAESAYKLEWMENPWADVDKAGDWLLELAEDYRPELVHLNGYAHAALDWHVPKIVVGHSCVLSWWEAVKGEQAPKSWSEYERRVALGLASADCVVAPSRAMMRCLKKHYGPLGKSVIIPNGRNPARHKARGAAKEPFIFSAGRLWDEAKNIKSLCQSAKDLTWKTCIAGDDTPPSGGTKQQFENVSFFGKLSQTEMIDRMARASIYALPAKYEPFGLSVLEAALSGCALALGDIDSLRENWSDAAIFVDPNDPAELEKALLFLILNPGIREEYAGRALERAMQFSSAKMAEAYVALYQEALESEEMSEPEAHEEFVAA